MDKREFGTILRNLRLKAGYTQKQVGQMIGRNQPIIGHWETGYSQPDADTLFKLCKIYGVSVDEAFGFTEVKSKKESFDKLLIEAYYTADESTQRNVRLILGIENAIKKTSRKEA